MPPPREMPAKDRPRKMGAAEDGFLGITIASPSRETLFRMESEAEMEERLQKEQPEWRGMRLDSTSRAYSPLPERRGWGASSAWVEPNRFSYGRLFFEQTGPERYGRDLGPTGTLMSIAWFGWDLGTYPVRVALPPWRWSESNEGRALPGDPQPASDRGFPFRTWRAYP
ncbi:MAG: hypothetical protein U0744_15175 [Gemmataceae bacterium]